MADPVRILRVIARLNMGGPAYHVGLLGGGLTERGYQSLIVAGRVGPGEASMADVAHSAGATVHELRWLRPEIRPLSDARALVALIRLLRSFRPDMVCTHTAKAGLLGRLAALCMRPRPVIVHTYHGHVLEGYFGRTRSTVYRVLEKALASPSDCLIGVSEQTVADLVRLGIAPREKFCVVPLGLDLTRFVNVALETGAAFRREAGAGATDVLLVYIGRVVPIKRLDLLLEAHKIARQSFPNLRLAVVGDGPTRPQLEVMADRLGTRDAIHFAGYRRDLDAITAAADIGVLSSDNEGTPVSLIELGAAGKPLVATAAGGVPEVVTPQVGATVPVGDVGGLAREIASLAGDPARREVLGEAAREQMLSRHTSDRLVADIDALYRTLLA